MWITAACTSDTGKIRRNNEDNFCFDGTYLPADHIGTECIYYRKKSLSELTVLSVFDGMGGENYGELASFAAAKARSGMRSTANDMDGYYSQYTDMVMKLNSAVVEEADRMLTSHMGTTMVEVCLWNDQYVLSNVGDSRGYLWSGNSLKQLTVDHCDYRWARTLPNGKKAKAPLTQCLGMSPEECIVEPMVKRGIVKAGNRFLICSDGLTDMVTDERISEILAAYENDVECVRVLRDEALLNGGRDNITIVLCSILSEV